jgi:hypothetical protein
MATISFSFPNGLPYNILCDLTKLPKLKHLELKNTQILKYTCDLLEFWALGSDCGIFFEQNNKSYATNIQF